MATTTPWGIISPDNSSPHPSKTWWDNIAASVNQALTDAHNSAVGEANAHTDLTKHRIEALTDTNLDTFTAPIGATGVWRVSASQGITGFPPQLQGGAAFLESFRNTSTAGFQRWITVSGTVYERVQSGGAWSEWIVKGSGGGGGTHTPMETSGFWTTRTEEDAYLGELGTRENVTRFTVGQSVEDRPIYGVKIGDPTKPAILMVGTQHGDEIGPREGLMMYAQELAQADTLVLLDLCVIIIPTLNTDRLDNTRDNANGVNLNRDWEASGRTQPEVQAVVNTVLNQHNVIAVLDCHNFGYMREVSMRPSGFGAGPVQERAQRLFDDVTAAYGEIGQACRLYGEPEDEPTVGTIVNELARTARIPGLLLEVPYHRNVADKWTPTPYWHAHVTAVAARKVVDTVWRERAAYLASKANQAFTAPARQLTLTERVGESTGEVTALTSRVSTIELGSSLTSEIDLDTVTTPGSYLQPNNGGAALVRNYPIAGARGTLVVRRVSLSGNLSQTYMATENGQLFHRERYSDTWGAWVNVTGGAADTDLADRVTDLELGILLGTADLNTMTTPGGYLQNSGGNATLARNYPAASIRGTLTVRRVSADDRSQIYTNVATGQTWHRGYLAGVWSAWVDITGFGAIRNLGTLSSTDLDTVLTPGYYWQGSNISAALAESAHYPAQSRGVLTVNHLANGAVTQSYHASRLGQVWVREYYQSAWSDWSQPGGGSDIPPSVVTDLAVLDNRVTGHGTRITALEGASGGNPITGVIDHGDGTISFTLTGGGTTSPVAIPAAPAADQADYVDLVRGMSSRNALEVRKVQEGRFQVTAYSPSGQHTTVLFRAYDDYYVASTVHVGNTTGSTRNLTTDMAGGNSNKEYAIQVAPHGSGLAPNWVPLHNGVASAFEASTPRLFDGDTEINFAGMTDGQVRANVGDKIQFTQHIIGRHPDAPGTDLIEVWTTHTIHADGTMTVTGRVRALVDVVLGNAYLLMIPVHGSFDTLISSLGNTYPNTPDLYGTNTNLVPESDVATSYLFLNSGQRDRAVAFKVSNPAESWRRGGTNKPPPGQRIFLQHRDADLAKVYPRPWSSGTVMAAGEITRFAGEYLYLQAPGLYDALAR